MSENEFVGLMVQYISNVELFFLRTNFCIEAYVHQHVTKFFHHFVLIVATQCIAEFKGLFNGVWP